MKKIAIIIMMVLTASCGGDADVDGHNSGSTSGTITLSGNDTAIVGTQLDTGFIGASPASGTQPDSIIIVNSASTVLFPAADILIPDLADPNNGFVIVVTDASDISGFKVISMSVFVNGEKIDYACTSPAGVFIDCGSGSISLDIDNKTVSFSNLTVQNLDTDSVLTLDGMLAW